MRISDWSSDVCSSDLATDQEESVDLPALGHEGISDQASRRAREADDCGAPLAEPRHHLAGQRQLHDRGQQADPGEAEPDRGRIPAEADRRPERRSEEHTSELQSLMRISYAVFCLNKNKK